MTRRPKATTAIDLAQQLADLWIQERLQVRDFLGSLMQDDFRQFDHEFEDLRARVLEELCDSERERLMETAEYLSASDRVRDSLPDDNTRQLLFRISENDEARHDARTDAAFLFGLALGRRLGGVV